MFTVSSVICYAIFASDECLIYSPFFLSFLEFPQFSSKKTAFNLSKLHFCRWLPFFVSCLRLFLYFSLPFLNVFVLKIICCSPISHVLWKLRIWRTQDDLTTRWIIVVQNIYTAQSCMKTSHSILFAEPNRSFYGESDSLNHYHFFYRRIHSGKYLRPIVMVPLKYSALLSEVRQTNVSNWGVM